MLRMTFGEKQVYSSRDTRAMLQSVGKPIPPDLEKCNSLWNPLGPSPMRGWLLMARGDIDQQFSGALNVNGLHTLAMEFDPEDGGAVQTITFSQLVICSEPLNLFSTEPPNDPAALYLVEVADARWRVKHVAINKIYNARAWAYQSAGGTTEYLDDSLNAGTMWTWQAMFADVWNLMSGQLGPAPTLPVTPNGTPEGFVFQGMAAWDALTLILSRIGCAFRAGTEYGVVQVGAADQATDAIIAANLAIGAGEREIHDGQFLPIIRGKVPKGVRVFFGIQSTHPGMSITTSRTNTAWQTYSVYSVDVNGPDSATAEPGTYHPIWDDLPAIYDNSAGPTNTAAMAVRAAERAADFFRQHRSVGGTKLWQRFSGILDIAPGSTIKGVCWREAYDTVTGNAGIFTEILNKADVFYSVGPGCWQEREDSTKLHPPDFRPTWPHAPIQVTQLLQITSGTPFDGRYGALYAPFYPAQIVKRTPESSGSNSFENVWAWDLSGATSMNLATGSKGRYMGTLVSLQGPTGSAALPSQRPVYAFNSCDPAGSAYTDEAAQDAVGGILDTSSSLAFGDIAFIYTD